ncbi:MAG: amino acid adenylation domain-containing protein [Dehalococcoidia bacterium]
MSVPATDTTYPLSPIQQGMLFQNLLDPNSGTDITQVVGTIREPIDLTAFKQAWHWVTRRHAVLRTGFHWEGLPEPLQSVVPDATLAIEEHDLREHDSEQQQRLLEEYQQAERRRGFDLAQAPLYRLAIFTLDVARYDYLITCHHIILDGRSHFLILKEVFSIYQAICQGQDPQLDNPQPFVDHVMELRNRNLSGAEEYWRGVLKGITGPTPLNLEPPAQAPPGEALRHRWQEQRLSESVTSALRAGAQQHQITLNILLQGAWALLLHRYSQEEDIVFGTVRAGRHSSVPGAQNMIGNFINCPPVRVHIDPDEPLIPWLQRLRAQDLAVREFEQTPISEIQQWSDCTKGILLYDSLVVYDAYLLDAGLHRLGDNWEKWHCHLLNQPIYPLAVYGYGESEMLLQVACDPTRFDDQAASRTLGHLLVMLGAMAENLDRKLSDLPILTEAEQQQLITQGQQRGASFPESECLHRLFEGQAARTPDSIAVSYQGETISYRELNQRTNRLAHQLQRQGIVPDDLVGICLRRSPDLIVGILAILKAGAAYLPLDPDYPGDRLTFMVRDAGVTTLVSESSLADLYREWPVATVLVDAPAADDDPAHLENPVSSVAPANLAYVIYTSGSTGNPKGVQVTHYNVVRLFEATESWFQFNDADTWTLFHSFAFDFSVWEIWGPLLYGGKLVVVPAKVAKSPEDFYSLLIEQKVTVLNQTPSSFRQLMPVEASGNRCSELALRLVIFGGEALEIAGLAPWFERHGADSPRLVNMYGITETTVHVTYRPICASDVAAGTGSLIGIPIRDLQIYLLDPQQRPVPVGVAGEIYVGGAGLARGYLNRPDLTAERFVPDPFSPDADARLYRTGDRARYRSNGELEYLGRLDQQVKIRGFRIETGEIEARLRQQPTVQEAVVIAKEEGPGDARLIAYLVPEAGHQTSPADLRFALQQTLPEFMVPAAFVEIEAIPLTANGKLDRKSLPAPDHFAAGLTAEFVPPSTEVEKSIAQIWQEVLGVSRVGVNDNFFELGGHSLLLVAIHDRLKQALDVNFPMAQMFQFPTVKALASFLSRDREQSSVTADLMSRARRQRESLAQRRQALT